MEINKVVLNGVEYAVSDTQAKLITDLLGKRVDYLETEAARLEKKIDENKYKIQLIDLDADDTKAELQQLKDSLTNVVTWREIRE